MAGLVLLGAALVGGILSFSITTNRATGCDIAHVLVSQIERDMENTKATPPELFPDIPPDRFRELIQKSVRTQKASIEELEHLPC